MNYRTLGNTGLKVSEIGIGCEGFLDKTPAEVRAYVDKMEELGVNCIDLYAPNPGFRTNLGEALKGRRETFVLQAHLCTIWQDGQYERSREIDKVKASFEDQLERLGTDHVEIGMIHYVDSMEDWHTVKDGPVMAYALDLKKRGVIGCIGMSSHNPEVSLAAVESGLMICFPPPRTWMPSGMRRITKTRWSTWTPPGPISMKPANGSALASPS